MSRNFHSIRGFEVFLLQMNEAREKKAGFNWVGLLLMRAVLRLMSMTGIPTEIRSVRVLIKQQRGLLY